MAFEVTAPASPFSADYAEARRRFLAATTARGCRLESIPIGLSGPSGEDLTIDVATLGASDPERTVVVSSGLHGVEGFFGSAAQTAYLERTDLGRSPGPTDALIFLHALNPYGFAWVRRFDEENIDLNRNLLVAGQPYQGSPPRYDSLNSLLNPETPPSRFNMFLLRSVLTILLYGMGDLKAAVAGGQYEYPRGIFFGGRGPSGMQKLLAHKLPIWLCSARTVVHVDFHTGLGRWGTYRILLEPEVSREDLEWTRRTFGPESVEHWGSEGISYPTRGDVGTWCRSLFPGCQYHYLCAEFGTYPPLRVLSALRAENQAHHTLSPGQPAYERAKRTLKEMFAPESAAWRTRTIADALYLLDTACESTFELRASHGEPP